MNIAKDKLHETLNMANKLGLEECSHHIRYADDCPECERVWDEAYPPTISKAAYDGAREDLLIWKKRALEAEKQLAEIKAANVQIEGQPAVGLPLSNAGLGSAKGEK